MTGGSLRTSTVRTSAAEDCTLSMSWIPSRSFTEGEGTISFWVPPLTRTNWLQVSSELLNVSLCNLFLFFCHVRYLFFAFSILFSLFLFFRFSFLGKRRFESCFLLIQVSHCTAETSRGTFCFGLPRRATAGTLTGTCALCTEWVLRNSPLSPFTLHQYRT